VGFAGEGQEVEVIGILQELLSQVGLERGKGARKVSLRLSLAAIETRLDLHDKNVPAPAILNSLFDVPGAFGGVLNLVEQPDIMAPGQLCNKLLHNCLIRPSLGESPHIFEVTR